MNFDVSTTTVTTKGDTRTKFWDKDLEYFEALTTAESQFLGAKKNEIRNPHLTIYL